LKPIVLEIPHFKKPPYAHYTFFKMDVSGHPIHEKGPVGSPLFNAKPEPSNTTVHCKPYLKIECKSMLAIL
jgi:hypothetical protein